MQKDKDKDVVSLANSVLKQIKETDTSELDNDDKVKEDQESKLLIKEAQVNFIKIGLGKRSTKKGKRAKNATAKEIWWEKEFCKITSYNK
jgi:hypothetical protein